MIGCSRMYDLNAAVAALWRTVFTEASRRAGVALEVVEHRAPAPLGALWARSDMGLVFMCGWPFHRAAPRPMAVAAPIPVGAGCVGPRYRSDMVVRVDAPFRTLADTFGGRLAWTDEASHSGFNAPRRLLCGLRGERARLYGATVGPLLTPRAALASVLEGRADVAPLDSYFHALLRRHEPSLAASVRVVASTPCAPMPLLVASPGADAGAVAALRMALLGFGDEPAMTATLADLCLKGFAAVPDADVYAVAEDWSREAIAADYPCPA